VTQLRKYRDSISNYFDDVLRGIGKRGSSFADVDAITHDKDGNRFLFQEFKEESEAPISIGQSLILQGLTRKDYVTVWAVRRMRDGSLKWRDYALSRTEVISVAEYRRRFAGWWANRWPEVLDECEDAPSREAGAQSGAGITATDIHW
jgi:hypothetical protein